MPIRRNPRTPQSDGSQPSALGDVGKETELPRALHRAGELALMAPACPGDAGGADLALLAHGATQGAEVLVVHDIDLVATEGARLAASAGPGALLAVAPPRLLPATTLLCHLKRTPLKPLERDVVVPGSTTRRRRLEVGGIRRNVALRRETTAVLGAVPRAQELDRIGNDIHRLALVAVLVLPLAPFEPP